MYLNLVKMNLRRRRSPSLYLRFPKVEKQNKTKLLIFFPSDLQVFWPWRLAVARAEAFTSWGDGDWAAGFASAIRSVREGASHGEGEYLRYWRDRAH